MNIIFNCSKEMKLLLCLIVYSVAAVDLPPDFPKCRRTDPNLNECIKKAYAVIVPKLVNGIPELNLDHILPFKVDALTIGEGSGPVQVVQHYKNVEFRNLESSIPKSVQASVTDDYLKMSFDVFVPNIIMFADYDFDGYILFLPMVGNGKVTITTVNVTLKVDMEGEVVTIKEERYAKLNSLNISMDPIDCEVEFTNLFNGDEQLGAEMNHILSANCLAIYHDVRAGYEESGALACKSFLNELFAKVPYNVIFPL